VVWFSPLEDVLAARLEFGGSSEAWLDVVDGIVLSCAGGAMPLAFSDGRCGGSGCDH
jgi:hypothetical protein